MTEHLCEIVYAAALRPGDEVTETETPAGPWYVVMHVDPERRVVTVDDGQGLLVTVLWPTVGGGLVLRRTGRTGPHGPVGPPGPA